MSKPREIWWSYVKTMIRQYPKMAAESNALSKLPVVKQKEFLAVKEAISITKEKENAENRMAIINLVIWHSGCTLDQAAARLYLSESTAYRYHRDFIQLVGECYGLAE